MAAPAASTHLLLNTHSLQMGHLVAVTPFNRQLEKTGSDEKPLDQTRLTPSTYATTLRTHGVVSWLNG